MLSIQNHEIEACARANLCAVTVSQRQPEAETCTICPQLTFERILIGFHGCFAFRDARHW